MSRTLLICEGCGFVKVYCKCKTTPVAILLATPEVKESHFYKLWVEGLKNHGDGFSAMMWEPDKKGGIGIRNISKKEMDAQYLGTFGLKAETSETVTMCNCLGPQNGDKFCPCLMNKWRIHEPNQAP